MNGAPVCNQGIAPWSCRVPCQNRQNLVRQRVRLAIELGNDGIPPSYLNRLAGRLRSSPAELGIRIMGYEIADHEWSAVGPAACWSHRFGRH